MKPDPLTDREILRIAGNFRSGMLDNASSRMTCFMVCAPLLPLLEYGGHFHGRLLESTVTCGAAACNHIFIGLDDGRVLDPTADQFNDVLGTKMPKVYLGEPIAHLHGNAHALMGEAA